jgi:hypothetical protein
LPVFVDSTVKEIDGRLHELRDEVSKLEAARAALVGNGAAPASRDRRGPGRPRGPRTAAMTATATRRTDRPAGQAGGRRSGNTRSNQALELVRKRPGVTIPQLAEAMKIEPNYLYRVMPKLVSDGQVTRDGQGWHPAS